MNTEEQGVSEVWLGDVVERPRDRIVLIESKTQALASSARLGFPEPLLMSRDKFAESGATKSSLFSRMRAQAVHSTGSISNVSENSEVAEAAKEADALFAAMDEPERLAMRKMLLQKFTPEMIQHFQSKHRIVNSGERVETNDDMHSADANLIPPEEGTKWTSELTTQECMPDEDEEFNVKKWRFDFDGNMLRDEARSLAENDSELFHHGEKAGLPGYTVDELSTLSMSTVSSQRVIGIKALGCCIARFRCNEIPRKAQMWDLLTNLSVPLVLRRGLDSESNSVVRASFVALKALLVPEALLATLDEQADRVHGRELISLFPFAKRSFLNQENEYQEGDSPFKTCRSDVVQALIDTNIVERIAFHFDQHVCDDGLQVLTRLALHSAAVCKRIASVPRLFTHLLSSNSVDRPVQTWLLVLRLFQILSRQSASIAHSIAYDTSLPAVVTNFIVSDDDSLILGAHRLLQIWLWSEFEDISSAIVEMLPIMGERALASSTDYRILPALYRSTAIACSNDARAQSFAIDQLCIVRSVLTCSALRNDLLLSSIFAMVTSLIRAGSTLPSAEWVVELLEEFTPVYAPLPLEKARLEILQSMPCDAYSDLRQVVGPQGDVFLSWCGLVEAFITLQPSARIGVQCCIDFVEQCSSSRKEFDRVQSSAVCRALRVIAATTQSLVLVVKYSLTLINNLQDNSVTEALDLIHLAISSSCSLEGMKETSTQDLYVLFSNVIPEQSRLVNSDEDPLVSIRRVHQGGFIVGDNHLPCVSLEMWRRALDGTPDVAIKRRIVCNYLKFLRVFLEHAPTMFATLSEVGLSILRIFLFEERFYGDREISALLIEVLSTTSCSTIVDPKFGEELVEKFTMDSFGDETFAWALLLLLRKDQPEETRYGFWTKIAPAYVSVCPMMRLPFGCPGDYIDDGCLSRDLLRSMIDALISGLTPSSNWFFYWIAAQHVCLALQNCIKNPEFTQSLGTLASFLIAAPLDLIASILCLPAVQTMDGFAGVCTITSFNYDAIRSEECLVMIAIQFPSVAARFELSNP